MPLNDAPPLPAADVFFDEAPCGLALTASDGTIERANRAFRQWLGLDAEELIGKRRFQDLLTVGGRIFYQTHFAPLLQLQGSVTEVKLDLRGADGITLPAMINARCHAGGRVSYAVFVAKDRAAYERELMLARRRAEEAVERERAAQDALRQADRRKDEFLAMLAHELRNPLAPVAAAAHLLQRAPADPERVRHAAGVIGRQVQHLTHLVDDLLDVSRVTRGLIALDAAPVDLAEVVAAAVEQARTLIDARGHALQVDVPPGWIIEGDRTRLVQVVANLLTNAAKYTPPGGRIDVRADAHEAGVQLDVTDTGNGIEATLMPHLFELFSQAERTPDRTQGGLGIGLALVHSLVALHGGRVEAHSEGPGRGSRFSLWWPARRHGDARPALPLATSGTAIEDGAPRSTRLDVLVVDDNRDAAGTLADVVRLAGHSPDVAGTGAEALDRLARQTPDACILDIGLPDMTGHALAERIRAACGGRTPLLIALTGYGQPQDRARSQQAGFDHHLVKPVDPAMLLQLLEARARSGAG